MKKLDYGTKVLFFEDTDIKLNGEYCLATIVSDCDDKNNPYEYTVKTDKEEGLYISCKYFENIITPVDYEKYLTNELSVIDYQISMQLEKKRETVYKLRKLIEDFSNEKTEDSVIKM